MFLIKEASKTLSKKKINKDPGVEGSKIKFLKRIKKKKSKRNIRKIKEKEKEKAKNEI